MVCSFGTISWEGKKKKAKRGDALNARTGIHTSSSINNFDLNLFGGCELFMISLSFQLSCRQGPLGPAIAGLAT